MTGGPGRTHIVELLGQYQRVIENDPLRTDTCTNKLEKISYRQSRQHFRHMPFLDINEFSSWVLGLRPDAETLWRVAALGNFHHLGICRLNIATETVYIEKRICKTILIELRPD